MKLPPMKSPMTCEEFDLLLDLGNPLGLSEEARQHAAGCTRCRTLAGALNAVRDDVLPASALARAEQAATRDLKPVRPLSGPLTAAAGAVVALVVLAMVGVAVLGTHGWVARLLWQRVASYLGAASVLALCLATVVRERVPGFSLAAPWRYAVAALAALLWIGPFVLYPFEPEARFWKHGALCCCEGLLVGTAAGAVLWFVMRRGYLVSPQRAGWFAGIAAGSLAFIVQETYCPVVESAHAALWHGGVAAVLSAVGWLAGPRLFRRD